MKSYIRWKSTNQLNIPLVHIVLRLEMVFRHDLLYAYRCTAAGKLHNTVWSSIYMFQLSTQAGHVLPRKPIGVMWNPGSHCHEPSAWFEETGNVSHSFTNCSAAAVVCVQLPPSSSMSYYGFPLNLSTNVSIFHPWNRPAVDIAAYWRALRCVCMLSVFFFCFCSLCFVFSFKEAIYLCLTFAFGSALLDQNVTNITFYMFVFYTYTVLFFSFDLGCWNPISNRPFLCCGHTSCFICHV